jgi:diguanylate cyclase (GGDEF)-like protein
MMRYRIKLVLILLGLVVALQTSSYIATRTVIRDTVIEGAYRDLDSGGRLFSQLMTTRARQLAQSVNVLTADFDFKQAVASNERATIRSALDNHLARIDADIALVIDLEGQLTASSTELNLAKTSLVSELQGALSASGTLYAPMVIDGALYQVVFSPINAPVKISTAGIGFEIDQDLSEHLKSLTDLDVSFWWQHSGQAHYLNGTLNRPVHEHLYQPNTKPHQPHQKVWRNGDVLYNRVLISEQPQTIVAVLQAPLARALKPFAVLDTRLISLALTFLVVAGFIALVLARNVTRPIQNLAGVARVIAKGNYDSPVTVRGKDEFTDLSRAFTRMQQAIAEREKKIVFQAQYDSLTGLANRSQVFPLLQQALALADQRQQIALIAIVDIYKFTLINDTLGADIGDLVLQELAARLRLFVHNEGRAIRLGSDEFLLVLHAATMTEASKKIEQLHQSSSEPLHIDQSDIRAELNIGYAHYPTDGDRPELLLRRANLALNHARQSMNGVSAYHRGWEEDHLRRTRLLGDFKTALKQHQIKLHYQPKITPAASNPVSAEALVRWQHPTLGFVNPEEFISVIESAGQITILTRWVIAQAAKLVARLQKQQQPITVAINLSALDLLDDKLCAYITQQLSDHHIPAHSLCFEVTESAVMREAEKSLATLKQLHQLGTRLAIDDYGTGYSSLSQLKKLPVDELKIDKSFVLGLDHNTDDQEIVKSTIELSHSLHLSVTAEGVETAASRDWLLANGCDTLQGYYVSKAVSADAFIEWLEHFLTRDDIR